jgi:ABC-2 type transport system permease protein
VRTIFFLVRKEFLQIFRDRTTVFQIFMIPVVQLLVLANAATFDVKRVAMLVVDEDRTTVSTGLVQRLTAGKQFRVVRYEGTEAGADRALLDREVTAVLHIPRHFEKDLV